MRVLSSRAIQRMEELVQSPYHPKQILELKEQIETSIRVVELKATTTGQLDLKEIQAIVEMKIKLDTLYCMWFEEEIE